MGLAMLNEHRSVRGRVHANVCACLRLNVSLWTGNREADLHLSKVHIQAPGLNDVEVVALLALFDHFSIGIKLDWLESVDDCLFLFTLAVPDCATGVGVKDQPHSSREVKFFRGRKPQDIQNHYDGRSLGLNSCHLQADVGE